MQRLCNAELFQYIILLFSLQQEVGAILAILASILHISDIQFEYDYETDGVYIRNESMMEMGKKLQNVEIHG